MTTLLDIRQSLDLQGATLAEGAGDSSDAQAAASEVIVGRNQGGRCQHVLAGSLLTELSATVKALGWDLVK